MILAPGRMVLGLAGDAPGPGAVGSPERWAWPEGAWAPSLCPTDGRGGLIYFTRFF